MYVFWPRRRQPPPAAGSTVVPRRCAFDPAPGSVNAKQKRPLPAAIPGSHAARCASVPCRATIVPAIAVEMTSLAAGKPPAASRSEARHSSSMPPAPPCSSGSPSPVRPTPASSSHWPSDAS